MSERGWWGVVALGIVLGLVVGGVAGYAVGQDAGSEPSALVRDQTESSTATSEDEGADEGAVEFSDEDICMATDIAQALDIFGRNSGYPVNAPTLTQLKKAGELFDRASDLADDPNLAAALDKLAAASMAAEVDDVYSFAPYNRFVTACSGVGLG